MIDETIRRLEEYVDEDEIYKSYTEGTCKDFSDFEIFCINHCKDIELIIGELNNAITKYNNSQLCMEEMINAWVKAKDEFMKSHISIENIQERINLINKEYKEGNTITLTDSAKLDVLEELLKENKS